MNAVEPPASHTSWPTVIGVLAILVAIFDGLRFGCCTAFDPWFLIRPFYPGLDWPAGLPGQQAATAEYVGLIIAANVIAAMAAMLLLVGGIGLIIRWKAAAKLCLAWAGIKAAYAIVAAVMLAVVINRQVIAAATDRYAGYGNSPPIDDVARVAWIALALVLVLRLVFPAFLISWLRRRRIRDEVRQWPPPSRRGRSIFVPTAGTRSGIRQSAASAGMR
jgi:hypothetical protein